MVFLSLPSRKHLIYLLLLYLIFAVHHLSMASFLINSKLQRFSRFLKVMTFLCSQNYRPISILPCLSKVFNKLFYPRLSGFLTKFNILNHNHYGFRPYHSTAMAILELINNIYEGFENNQYTVGVFVDLKKAFDTVNHEILLDKLNFYSITGIPLTWLTSYLSHRQQYVMVHDRTSSYNLVVCGVPQGSVLGPLLFLYTSMIFFMSPTSCLSFSLLMIQISFFVIMTWLP